MRILVDMDGVLADFENGFLKNWQEKYPDQTFIPLAERNIFYVSDQYPETVRSLVFSVLCAPEFFRSLEPIPGSLEALKEMKRLGHEVFICTSPLGEYQHCVLEKFEWVDEHLGPGWVSKIILTNDKTIVSADILIDDRPDIQGVAIPNWEHILYDQPYNRSGTTRRRLTWQNWQSVLLAPQA